MVEKSLEYLRQLEGKCGYMDTGQCVLGLPPSAYVWRPGQRLGHRVHSLEQCGWLLGAHVSDLGKACGF